MNMNSQGSYCKYCKWLLSDGQSGSCRRYPPQLVVAQILNPKTGKVEPVTNSFFPKVLADWSCGEFKVDIIKK